MKLRQMISLLVVVGVNMVSTGCASVGSVPASYPRPTFNVGGRPAYTYSHIQKTGGLFDVVGQHVGWVVETTMASADDSTDMKTACELTNIYVLCATMKEEKQCAVVHPPVVTEYWVGEVDMEVHDEALMCRSVHLFRKKGSIATPKADIQL